MVSDERRAGESRADDQADGTANAAELSSVELISRARRELAAACAVLGDPLARTRSCTVHFRRAWLLFTRAGGEVSSSTEPLAAWIRESDDAAEPPEQPNARALRRHARALDHALRSYEQELDGWPARRQNQVRWLRRAVIALFVIVPLALLAAMWWRDARPGRWRGAYYPYDNFNGVPVVRRDKDVSFNWGRGRPRPQIPPDLFSVRWETCLDVGKREKAAFQLISNNGSRLYIDGDLVVDNWDNPKTRARGGYYDLSKGSHHLRVDYRELRRTAQVQLLATFDDDPPRPIPASVLRYPGDELTEGNPCTR